MEFRQHRSWMELILPVYSLAIVIVYYRPEAVPPTIMDTLMAGNLKWVFWVIAAALGGLLTFSALFLAFCLVYAPVYLLNNAKRILNPQAWIDHREVRFYLGCFVVLCMLLALALLNPVAGAAFFVLLAGSASFLWRYLA